MNSLPIEVCTNDQYIKHWRQTGKTISLCGKKNMVTPLNTNIKNLCFACNGLRFQLQQRFEANDPNLNDSDRFSDFHEPELR